MEIGPLEYVVIGLQDHHFRQDVLPELKSIQQSGLIRVIDLLFVRKVADGTVTIQEVSELSKEEREAYSDLEDALGDGSLSRISRSWLKGSLPGH